MSQQSSIKWQYQSKNKWYDYGNNASEKIEKAYQEYLKDPSTSIDVVCVKSGKYNYQVDFICNTQTNIEDSMHLSNHVRRQT